MSPTSSDQGPDAGPELHYEGRTPFVAYTSADVLHDLVHTNTDEPLEANFVIVTQIMELHFELLRREWQLAITRLRADDVHDAVEVLRRSGTAQLSLLAAWGMLEPMSPVQYNRFRSALGKASGFQSFGYRELEFLLGAKDELMLRPHAGMPAIAARLQQTFDAPSLYDEAVALLARRGVSDWRSVYLAGGELAELAEALIGVAERHTRWRFVHYAAVYRILGNKPGTGGSAGLAWLKRAADTMIFPELWAVRGEL